MRNLNRDQRNIGGAVLCGDDRRDILVGLKFDHEVDFLPDQQVGIALRDFGVVLIVDRDQFDSLCGCRSLYAV